jgi:hypothetical protein
MARNKKDFILDSNQKTGRVRVERWSPGRVL